MTFALLVTVVLTLILIGVLIWAVDAFPWISSDIKKIIKILIVVMTVFWLIGVIAGIVPTPHFR